MSAQERIRNTIRSAQPSTLGTVFNVFANIEHRSLRGLAMKERTGRGKAGQTSNVSLEGVSGLQES